MPARRGERAWGVQFHPELDEPALDHGFETWDHAPAEAAVIEARARAAGREHLPGRRALSEAISGGFARVARTVRG